MMRTAFRLLSEHYFRLVFGVAQRVTGSSALAEEVCQDVFVLLAQQSRKLLARGMNLAAWLHVREHRLQQRDHRFVHWNA